MNTEKPAKKGFFARIDAFGPLKESPNTVSISLIELTVGEVKKALAGLRASNEAVDVVLCGAPSIRVALERKLLPAGIRLPHLHHLVVQPFEKRAPDLVRELGRQAVLREAVA